jgi:hypothetical protein
MVRNGRLASGDADANQETKPGWLGMAHTHPRLMTTRARSGWILADHELTGTNSSIGRGTFARGPIGPPTPPEGHELSDGHQRGRQRTLCQGHREHQAV